MVRIRHAFLCIAIFSAIAATWNNPLKGAGVTVAWLPNSESNVSGYRIYYGKISRSYRYVVDVGNATEYVISAMPDSGKYYFAVRAYDYGDNESLYSDEASLYIPWDESMAPPEIPESTGGSVSNGSGSSGNSSSEEVADGTNQTQPVETGDNHSPEEESPDTDGEQQELDVNELPSLFAIMPNYPNPMNPVTNIPYYLKKTSDVKINIYDSVGRHVKTLKEEMLEPGQYVTLWDGTNMHGNAVASGVYICYMQVGYYSTTRKLNLIR